jgi:Uri superfamily endonuclease
MRANMVSHAQATNAKKSSHDGGLLVGIAREAGTYCLILRADKPQRIQVGRWGMLDVQPGYYLYVGSAFGRGGVNARVSRHCRETQARHWHVDYLRDVAVPVEVWCGYDSRDLEHRWAELLAGMCGVSSVPGFGCSDCKCESHLFTSLGEPDFECFSAVAGTPLDVCSLRPVAKRVNC